MTRGASCGLERTLAATLYWGTWVASSVVAVGLLLAMLDSGVVVREMAVQRDMRIASAGIAFFVLLPIIRVIVMLFAFLRDRDYRFSVIAALVLAITLLGLLAGFKRPSRWNPSLPYSTGISTEFCSGLCPPHDCSADQFLVGATIYRPWASGCCGRAVAESQKLPSPAPRRTLLTTSPPPE